MKNVKANITSILNENFTLTGFISSEDFNSTSDNKVRFYEEENDEDFFLIAKSELIF